MIELLKGTGMLSVVTLCGLGAVVTMTATEVLKPYVLSSKKKDRSLFTDETDRDNHDRHHDEVSATGSSGECGSGSREASVGVRLCRALSSGCRARSFVTALVQPLTTIGGAWLLLWHTEGFTRFLPALFTSSYGKRISDYLPVQPSNVQEAFDLGIAWHTLVSGGSAAEAVSIASRIAGRPVAESDIHGLPRAIQELMQHKDLVSRVASAFSLINTVWAISVLGLTVTVGPFIYILFEPFLKQLVSKMRILAVKLHHFCKPLYEPLLYAASLIVLVESARDVTSAAAAPDGMLGSMIAFTAICTFSLAWGQTLLRHGSMGSLLTAAIAPSTILALFSIPAAILHQSRFLGYISMSAVASALGFMSYSTGCCTYIGFGGRAALVNSSVGCGSLTLLNALAKVIGVQSRYLTPFVPAVSVLGTSVYLLTLDIHAFMSPSWSGYGLYIVNLAAYMAAGEFLGMPGMSNVAKVYTGLGVFTAYCKLHRWSSSLYIPWLFGLFSALYAASYVLSKNPALVVAVLSGGEL